MISKIRFLLTVMQKPHPETENTLGIPQFEDSEISR